MNKRTIYLTGLDIPIRLIAYLITLVATLTIFYWIYMCFSRYTFQFLGVSYGMFFLLLAPLCLLKGLIVGVGVWLVGGVAQVWDLEHHPRKNTTVVFKDGTNLVGSLKKNVSFQYVITTQDGVEHTLGRGSGKSLREYSIVKRLDHDSMLQHWRLWLPMVLFTFAFSIWQTYLLIWGSERG